MLKNHRDKIALSGISVLIIGLVLLIFTFISAYGFLTADLSIISTQDLVQTFGEALAPLITTCIHIMYLGVMGWVSSVITIRGVTIIVHTSQSVADTSQKPMVAEPKPQPQPQPQRARAQVQPQPQQQLQKPKIETPKKERPKEEEQKGVDKPAEPEMLVIPPEEMAQPQPPQNPPQQSSS